MKKPRTRSASEITPEEHRAASCAGKFGFETFSAAERTAKARRRARGTMKIYRCRHCREWHIGG